MSNYTASAWIFTTLPESPLHELQLPDAPPCQMILWPLYRMHNVGLWHLTLCTTIATTSMLGDKLLATSTGEEILSWLLSEWLFELCQQSVDKRIRGSSNATSSFQVNLCLVLYACLVKDMLQVWREKCHRITTWPLCFHPADKCQNLWTADC